MPGLTKLEIFHTAIRLIALAAGVMPLARLAARWRARRHRLELEALNSRMLRDVGLEHMRLPERRRLEAYWQRVAGVY